MTIPRWHRVKEIFGNALDVEPERRDEWLSERCADSPGILAEVRALLSHRERVTHFLERPALGGVARLGAARRVVAHSGPVTPVRARLVEVGQELVGRYVVGERIGAGAFGSVHVAEDRLTDRNVAIKVVGAGVANAATLRREVAILRRARLPGVVRLLDDWATAEATYIVMELVEGSPFPGTRAEAEEEKFAHGHEWAEPRGCDWERLAPLAVTLLETVGRLHWAGVFHRDLKPENVLVGEDGRLTVVDFGVASETGGAAPGVPREYIVGTPQYMAPERLRGRPATISTDVYGVGAMLWEALAGEPLHAADSLDHLIAQRCHEPARALRSVAPGVPEAVAEWIDRMVSRDPAKRPSSALRLAAQLGGDAQAGGKFQGGGEEQLPRVGPPDLVDAIVAAGREGRSIVVSGARGMGKTRALQDAAQRLAAEGFRVEHTVAASASYGSLVPVIGAVPADPSWTLADARSWVDRRLQSALDSGLIVVADGFEDLDEWSANALEGASGRGCVMRSLTDADGADFTLGPLRREDLRGLFAGPDRLHHLREDAADVLHARTAGVPAAFAREMSRWCRDGVARWEKDRAVIDRPALDRLRAEPRVALPASDVAADTLATDVRDLAGLIETAARRLDPEALARVAGVPPWRVEIGLEALEGAGVVRRDEDGRIEPLAHVHATSYWTRERCEEVHGAIADELPAGSEVRLFHLIAGGRLDVAPREAVEVAGKLHTAGDAWAAFAVLEDALALVRRAREPDPDTEEAALILMKDCALATGTAPYLELALYHCERARGPSRRTRALEQICRAALLAIRGDGRRALKLLEGARDDGTGALERSQHIVRAQAGRTSSPEVGREVVLGAARWVRRHPSRSNRALLSAWVGWVRYRQGRFLAAARLHRRAARLERNPRARLSYVLNAACAAIEAGAHEEARELARQAGSLARSARRVQHEARAEQILRAVAYREDRAEAPDLELLDATDLLGLPNLEGMIYLNEAAIAWRRGRGALAQGLANQAATRFGANVRWGRLLARALAAACEGAISEDDLASLMSEEAECPLPGISAQVLGLLAVASSEAPATLSKLARERASRIPEEQHERRREVLSVTESLARIGQGMDTSR